MKKHLLRSNAVDITSSPGGDINEEMHYPGRPVRNVCCLPIWVPQGVQSGRTHELHLPFGAHVEERFGVRKVRTGTGGEIRQAVVVGNYQVNLPVPVLAEPKPVRDRIPVGEVRESTKSNYVQKTGMDYRGGQNIYLRPGRTEWAQI